MSKVRSILVSPDTGEKVGEILEGDVILRKNSIDYLSSYRVWKVEHFYKGNAAEMKKLMEELTPSEKALLFSIAVYVGYEDCCLKHDNGNELTTNDLIRLSGLGRSTTFETINSLIQKDILYKGRNSSKNRQYFINPWIFCKGNRINKVLKTMFKNYKIRVLGGMQWKNIKDQ